MVKRKKDKGRSKDLPIYVPHQYLMETIDENLVNARREKLRAARQFGSTEYVKDPMDPDDCLITFKRLATALNMTSKHIRSTLIRMGETDDVTDESLLSAYTQAVQTNLVRWASHVTRLGTAYANDTPSRCLAFIPISSIFMVNDTMCEDDQCALVWNLINETIVNHVNKLFDAALASHVKVYLVHDVDIPLAWVVRFLRPNGIHSRRAFSGILTTEYDETTILSFPSFCLPIVTEDDMLRLCIEYGIPSVPDASLLTQDAKSTKKVKESALYRQWSATWNGQAVIMADSNSKLDALSKLARVFVNQE